MESARVPPPPPPPPPRRPVDLKSPAFRKGDAHQDLSHSQISSSAIEPFSVVGSTQQDTEYEFPTLEKKNGDISLRTVIGHYLNAPHSRKVPAQQLYHILGRLRCLHHAIENYNSGLGTNSSEHLQYWHPHTLELLSGFGFRPSPSQTPVCIQGLADIINHLECLYAPEISEYKTLIQSGVITFDCLSELFRPETPVKGEGGAGNTGCVYRVTDSFYTERKNIHGIQKNFQVSMECIVLVGEHFSIATFTETFPAWSENLRRTLSEIGYQPVTDVDRELFQSRGERYVQFGLDGAKYSAYAPHTFFPRLSRSTWKVSSLSKTSESSFSVGGGRIMVDMARGTDLGYFPCLGVNEVSLAIIGLIGRYRQWMSKRSKSGTTDSELFTAWESVPSNFRIFCWPALVGFSFTTKAWGHVLVEGLSEIDFYDQAFDRLVLSDERKQIISAVVRQGSIPQKEDLIRSKQGGLIFLLHGPPGVGKTLTAEAVAEVLHRPLYYVTMGELGVNPEDLEERLSDVLDLCAGWNALAVLDEADVFLESRSNSDLIRNAMVCVMLRILEYHPGILFLTTNRVKLLDAAFESRITIAIRYESLNIDARKRVWSAQLDGILSPVSPGINVSALAEWELNGRQIKNAVQLALCLAVDRQSPLTHEILVKTLQVTSLGRQNMVADNTWETSK
ncbi:hypothetical protein N7456_000380 [Penicillium angulare]|uniref:AAA+ ATPase domain-containing protein n=1 Tax=Penicillium angulare TaxID=116970 RepID=A0A9W9GCE3_9EURO|nr:hypothetical protein N7456_000380 [Penicillium angulare]